MFLNVSLHVSDILVDTADFGSTYIFPWSFHLVHHEVQDKANMYLLTAQREQNFEVHNVLQSLLLGVWTLVYQKTWFF